MEQEKTRLLDYVNGATGNAQAHKARHKPRSRRGKKGGSKFKSDDGVNKNGNPQNPE